MGSLKEHNQLIDIVRDEFIKLDEHSTVYREMEYDLMNGKHGEVDLLYINWDNEIVYNYEIKCSLNHEDYAYDQLDKNIKLIKERYKIKNIKSYLIYYTNIDKKEFGIKRYDQR